MARRPSTKTPASADNGLVVAIDSPGGAGMYLHWEGRRGYRTRIPAPRVIELAKKLSFREPDGNRIIEGDNLQVMVSLRSQYQSSFDIAYLDPPYNTGKGDFPYSDRRFHDPNADADDAVYVSNEDGCRSSRGPKCSAPNDSPAQPSTGSPTAAASSRPKARATGYTTPRSATSQGRTPTQ
jgi:hypothetical protein